MNPTASGGDAPGRVLTGEPMCRSGSWALPHRFRGLKHGGAIALTLLLGIEAAAQAAEAPRMSRIFAVAYRHEVARVVSYQTYRDSVRRQFLASVRPSLAAGVPNLVAYPENQTLMAYLIGARGATAREILASGKPNSSTAALASLAGTYKSQMDYYAAKFPGVDAPGQLLQLALTDTLARAVMETFGPLADEFDVYIAVSSNLAAFERIEGPNAVTLRDPEAGSAYAYEATGPEVFNRNFFFGPDGRLLAVQDKAYLVPIERARDAGLGLSGVEVHQLSVFDLPFARVGTVISKDAWMPDVNDRYDQLGAELLVQSEAFSTWGLAGGDLWPPDKFQRGGWWMVQKHPGVQVNVTPMLTGNFGDLTFDGQPLIAIKAPAGRPDGCLLGQRPEPGWAAVGTWAHYTDSPTTFCDPARRAEFRDVAQKLTPGSGDRLENAYAEDVVFADIRLPARPAPASRVSRGAFTDSVPIPGDAAQLQPALAAAADGAWVAWVDSRRGPNQSVFVSRTRDGLAWTDPKAVAPRPVTSFDHFDNQWSPAVLTDGAGAVVGHLGFPAESWDLFAVRLGVDGSPVGPSARVDDADREGGTVRERGHSSPILARAPDGTVLAVWSDLRWPWVKPQIRVARSADGGQTWSASGRADGAPVSAEDEQHNDRDPNETRGQSFPAVAVTRNRDLIIVWQELSPGGVPSIYISRSTDGGQRFGGVVRVSGEAAAWRPALLAQGDVIWLAYEEETASGGRRLMLRRSPDSGFHFTAAEPLDPSAPAGAVQRYVRLLAAGSGRVVAVFEDNRAGDSDILSVEIFGDGIGASQRVDDGPDGAEARAPAAAVLADGRLLVVWQDTRQPPERLRASLGSVRRRGGGTFGQELVVVLLAGVFARACVRDGSRCRDRLKSGSPVARNDW